MNISILTIGDEICIGQIVNTNAAWIASECTKTGAVVISHSSVGDEKSVIIPEIERLISISELLIITGGLGPTHDDITKSVLLDIFDDQLILNEKVLIELKKRFDLRGLKLTERNRQQAYLPSKCKVIWNNIGTAPGMMFSKNNSHLVSLPGVPSEMKDMILTSVIPFIKSAIHENKSEIVKYRNILASGIPESFLADLIGEPDTFPEGISLAYLPSYQGIRLRIGIKGLDLKHLNDSLDEMQELILSKAGKYVYGFDDDSLAKTTGKILTERKLTISVAESCTGGMLGKEFTENPGSSSYFLGGIISYSNEIKIKQLGINSRIIEKHGAVSAECAEAMAHNVRKMFNSDFGLSITGIAGPDGGTDDKPVGTVWIGLSSSSKTITRKYYFSPDRIINRERAVGTALNMLLKLLKGIEI